LHESGDALRVVGGLNVLDFNAQSQ
jgi:hypothetical protein